LVTEFDVRRSNENVLSRWWRASSGRELANARARAAYSRDARAIGGRVNKCASLRVRANAAARGDVRLCCLVQQQIMFERETLQESSPSSIAMRSAIR